MEENSSPRFVISDAAAQAISEAAHHATAAIEEICAAFAKVAEAASITARQLAASFDGIAAVLQESVELRAVATDRQWHLMNYGSPKVWKKWRNALRRKARIAEKRCSR